jgi:hypothetical protein
MERFSRVKVLNEMMELRLVPVFYHDFISCRTKLCFCILLRNLPKTVVFQS